MQYFDAFLVFIIGLTIGLFFHLFQWKIKKNKSNSLVPTINTHQYFNELEISVFQKILASKEKMISIQDLNLIINQENYPVAELNRLRRNFLKDLNLKIQIVFGISNGIWQVDTSDNKKLKYYMLSKKFKFSQLNKMFLS